MTKPRILVLTSEEGLNSNLLRLALGPWQFETHYATSKDVLQEENSRNNLGDIQWVVMDDKEVEDAETAQRILEKKHDQVSGIYLTSQKENIDRDAKINRLHILKKPFEPGELKQLLQT